jgi:hypothetical protein
MINAAGELRRQLSNRVQTLPRVQSVRFLVFGIFAYRSGGGCSAGERYSHPTDRGKLPRYLQPAGSLINRTIKPPPRSSPPIHRSSEIWIHSQNSGFTYE